ncbi:hypothetical protein ElyMa_004097200 [Elysia marginata]|uniref:Uncharacterized protein n=1 Tax=Elysia marginata TaxID=1093978 RepID=A0AAV4GCQ7_9GAST|nr:hypothetical protein ElyMa_004097200 [Elysia marginata]
MSRNKTRKQTVLTTEETMHPVRFQRDHVQHAGCTVSYQGTLLVLRNSERQDLSWRPFASLMIILFPSSLDRSTEMSRYGNHLNSNTLVHVQHRSR